MAVFRGLLVAAGASTATGGLLRVPVRRVARPAAARDAEGASVGDSDDSVTPMAFRIGVNVTGGGVGDGGASSAAALARITGGDALAAQGILQEEWLRNSENMGYAGTIAVGTPGQELTVVFDTGSANLWVPRSEGTRSTSHKSYDPSSSSTFTALTKDFQIQYGQGAVRGRFCKDDIRIGELHLTKFMFGEVTNTSALRQYERMDFDGVLGLGFRAISIDGVPTIMQELDKTGQLEQPVFGFYLGDNAPGELVFGGVDPQHYVGDFHFVDLSSATYWAVELEKVTVGRTMTLAASETAIVDSGTSLLVGPMDEVRALTSMLGAIQVSGYYLITCENESELPGLSFTMGGQDYDLGAQDLIIRRINGLCVLGIQGMSRKLWILGDVFMRKYYVQFDYGKRRVGFARARTVGDNFV